MICTNPYPTTPASRKCGHVTGWRPYAASSTRPPGAAKWPGRSGGGGIERRDQGGGPGRGDRGPAGPRSALAYPVPLADLGSAGHRRYGPRHLGVIRSLEEQHTRAYIPVPGFDSRSSRYGKQAFRYDPGADVYLCPDGVALQFDHRDKRHRLRIYRAEATTCNVCPLKARCTTVPSGRTVSRNYDEEYIDRVRAYQETDAFTRARGKRSVWVEPLFAEAKGTYSQPPRPSVRRTLVRGGQGLARTVTLPFTPTLAREHRGAAHRGRAEPQTAAQPTRLGSAAFPGWRPWGTGRRPANRHRHLLLTVIARHCHRVPLCIELYRLAAHDFAGSSTGCAHRIGIASSPHGQLGSPRARISDRTGDA